MSRKIPRITLWICLLLLGSNLAIDLLAIPLNFRLEAHTAQAAGLYGLRLFTRFFFAETFLLIIVLGGLAMSMGKFGIKGRAVLGVALTYLVSYLIYQRLFLLPEFKIALLDGDTASIHGWLALLEKGKVLCLAAAAVALESLR